MAKARAAATASEVKLLRDEIARLLTVNIDLRRQLEDLRRERSETPVESLAAAVAQSLRAAQAALVADAGEAAPHYTISDIDATFRGIVVGTPTSLALRLPMPEYGVLPGHLGSIRMALAAAPPPAGSPAPTVKVPPSPATRMAAALDSLQTAMGSWPAGRGATAARDMVTRTTQLLGAGNAWDDPETLAESAAAIGTTLRRLAKAVEAPKGASRAVPHRYQEAAGWLLDIARAVRAGQTPPADALAGIAAAAEHVSRALPRK